MHFTSAELGAWVAAYMWPLFRIGALIATAPVFGTRTVPVRVRVGLAIALAVIVAPVIPPAPAVDPLSGAGILIVVHQILIGVAMGFALQLVFHTFILGGQLIGQLMGLGFASMIDPQNGVSVPVISQVYTVFATLLFLAMDGHLLVIQVLADSFRMLPVGPQGLVLNNLWQLAVWGGWVFGGAVLIALPAVVALLVVNIAFGVVTRAAPQFNIFAVGFPVTLLLGFVIMILTLPNLLPQLESMTNGALEAIRGMLAGGR